MKSNIDNRQSKHSISNSLKLISLFFIAATSQSAKSFQDEKSGTLFQVFEDSYLKKVASCLKVDSYRFLAGYQMLMLECAMKKSMNQRYPTEKEVVEIEQCVMQSQQKFLNVSQSNWNKCYQSGQVARLLREEIKQDKIAQNRGATNKKQIFTPKGACTVTIQSNETFHAQSGDIFYPSGTVLPVSHISHDDFSVVLGGRNDQVSTFEPSEYVANNCSKIYLDALKAQQLTPVFSFAASDIKVYRSTDLKSVACTIPQGTKEEDLAMSVYPLPDDGDMVVGADYEIIYSEVEFESDSPVCAGVSGIIDADLFVSYVFPPEAGIHSGTGGFPNCTSDKESYIAFAERGKNGPEFYSCHYDIENDKMRWCLTLDLDKCL
ncbi:hypothetical protein [Aliikangiella maris]|uniref:Uncharacterized protein n=2 Tax=Aliikangiella maris TaxID=3162458 RepID=A0ABV3MLX8_9GAMM